MKVCILCLLVASFYVYTRYVRMYVDMHVGLLAFIQTCIIYT